MFIPLTVDGVLVSRQVTLPVETSVTWNLQFYSLCSVFMIRGVYKGQRCTLLYDSNGQMVSPLCPEDRTSVFLFDATRVILIIPPGNFYFVDVNTRIRTVIPRPHGPRNMMGPPVFHRTRDMDVIIKATRGEAYVIIEWIAGGTFVARPKLLFQSPTPFEIIDYRRQENLIVIKTEQSVQLVNSVANALYPYTVEDASYYPESRILRIAGVYPRYILEWNVGKPVLCRLSHHTLGHSHTFHPMPQACTWKHVVIPGPGGSTHRMDLRSGVIVEI